MAYMFLVQLVLGASVILKYFLWMIFLFEVLAYIAEFPVNRRYDGQGEKMVSPSDVSLSVSSLFYSIITFLCFHIILMCLSVCLPIVSLTLIKLLLVA